MAFNTQEDMTVTAEALAAAARGKWHIKVGWGSGPGTHESFDKHCTIAPCGFVEDNYPECRLHGPKSPQQPRQRHRVEHCPGAARKLP